MEITQLLELRSQWASEMAAGASLIPESPPHYDCSKVGLEHLFFKKCPPSDANVSSELTPYANDPSSQ